MATLSPPRVNMLRILGYAEKKLQWKFKLLVSSHNKRTGLVWNSIIVDIKYWIKKDNNNVDLKPSLEVMNHAAPMSIYYLNKSSKKYYTDTTYKGKWKMEAQMHLHFSRQLVLTSKCSRLNPKLALITQLHTNPIQPKMVGGFDQQRQPSLQTTIPLMNNKTALPWANTNPRGQWR